LQKAQTSPSVVQAETTSGGIITMVNGVFSITGLTATPPSDDANRSASSLWERRAPRD
jgi:hypothetical protein